MQLNITLQHAAEISAAWNAAPEAVDRELRRFAHMATLLIEREAKENAPTASGLLRKSITSETLASPGNVLGVVQTSIGHAVPVELGSKPHMPPVQPIRDWVKQKLGLRGKAQEQAAWRIAMSIKKKGVKKQPFFARAIDDNQAQIAKMWHETVNRIRQVFEQ